MSVCRTRVQRHSWLKGDVRKNWGKRTDGENSATSTRRKHCWPLQFQYSHFLQDDSSQGIIYILAISHQPTIRIGKSKIMCKPTDIKSEGETSSSERTNPLLLTTVDTYVNVDQKTNGGRQLPPRSSLLVTGAFFLMIMIVSEQLLRKLFSDYQVSSLLSKASFFLLLCCLFAHHTLFFQPYTSHGISNPYINLSPLASGTSSRKWDEPKYFGPAYRRGCFELLHRIFLGMEVSAHLTRFGRYGSIWKEKHASRLWSENVYLSSRGGAHLSIFLGV